MSGTGPESIPTSADPRSKRPTKRRALSPTSSQAASLTSLFSRPDQEIRTEAPAPRRGALPPDIVTNVQGSSAGAGSGEFHVYKAARRRERERLRIMEEDSRAEKEMEEFEREKRERETKDEARTRKNRERREKMKARKAKGKNGGKGGSGDNKQDGVEGNLTADVNSAGSGSAEAGDVRPSGNDADGGATWGDAEAEGLIIHDDD
ncbi:related to DUF1168 domain protein [Cephalotrichum gorgonifer]|uniref:Related to DUF1168 domain protein n=1 Tax=Cephalotrichum gorgonifer TaxID=2041049 RepID=A0AAE8SWP9_9PEZI|nr:related to DUF1168 domain protein [Cephalotrichum gorgonifer]